VQHLLQGVITSMLTPFTNSGALDIRRLRDELEFQINSEVDGICILGGTGESLSLSLEERLAVVKATNETVDKSVPVIVGCFVSQENEIIEFANRVLEIGASALMVTPSPFYKLTPFHIKELLNRISKQCNIPLVLYNAPRRSGVKLSAADIGAIGAGLPKMIGVKDAAGDIPDFIRMANVLGPRRSLLQGLDDVFLPALSSGGSGGILALASVFPRIFVSIYKSWKAGDINRAIANQMSILPVMDVINREPMPVLVKEAMAIIGRPVGPTRAPLYQPSDKIIDNLSKAVEHIKEI
jgi:4-hydroxy-tetrahydrodipicolinate synthase